MIKHIILIALLLSLVLSGCQTTEPTADEEELSIDDEISEIDSLDEDLSLEELDSIEDDLDAISW